MARIDTGGVGILYLETVSGSFSFETYSASFTPRNMNMCLIYSSSAIIIIQDPSSSQTNTCSFLTELTHEAIPRTPFRGLWVCVSVRVVRGP